MKKFSSYPICSTCRFFVKNPYVESLSTGNCFIFLKPTHEKIVVFHSKGMYSKHIRAITEEYSKNNSFHRYETCVNARSSDSMCGNHGKFYKEKVFRS